MAQASPEYITLDTYLDLRGKQVDLIRKEFQKQHDHFEDRCNGLREDIENVKVNIRLLQVEVGELKVDVNRMQGQMYNRSIRNLFTRIALMESINRIPDW
jgi:predicted nuclease with TOPRIM domain